MKEEEIKKAIENTVESIDSNWIIGITDDPRELAHAWRTNTKTIAKNVKNYFIEKGMSEGISEGWRYVYIDYLDPKELQEMIGDGIEAMYGNIFEPLDNLFEILTEKDKKTVEQDPSKSRDEITT